MIPQHIWSASQQVYQRAEIDTIQEKGNGHILGLEWLTIGGARSQNGHFYKGSEETGVPQESTPKQDWKDRCLYKFSSLT